MTSTTLDTTLGSVELIEQAGISYRQMDYWTRAGWLQPAPREEDKSGVVRRYGFEEVAVAQLLDAVLPLRHRIGDERLRLLIGRVRAGQRGTVKVTDVVSVNLDVLCPPLAQVA